MSPWTFLIEHRAEIFATTIEHLALVIMAMLIAILLGVPLGLLIVHRPVLRGVALGVAASLAMTRVMSSLLFGVSATDPFIFAIVPVVLVAVAAIACLLPARRATRLSPVETLRA